MYATRPVRPSCRESLARLLHCPGMLWFWLGFVVGGALGVLIGVVVTAALVAHGRSQH